MKRKIFVVWFLAFSLFLATIVYGETTQLTVKTSKQTYTFEEFLDVNGKGNPNILLYLPIKVSSPKILDLNGNPVNQVKINSKFLLSTKLENLAEDKQVLTYIVQVKDFEGKIVHLQFIRGTIPAEKTFTYGLMWTPKKAGKHVIEVYVWRSLAEPQPLAHPAKTEVEVLKPTAKNQSKIVYYGSAVKPSPVVTIQVFSPDGKRKAVAQARIGVDGSFYANKIYRFSLDDPLGNWTIKVYQAGIMEKTSFKLDKTPTTLTILVKPQKVELGEKIKVEGCIVPSCANAKVILTYEKAGGVNVSKVVVTDTEGCFQDEFKPDAGGTWFVVANWSGNEKFKASKSSKIKFEVVSKGCLIATATYGSEMAEEVQFLRGFREKIVYSTFAGKSFMKVFHVWYYSFSPTVAKFIQNNKLLKNLVKCLLYPLFGILYLSTLTYNIFNFNCEIGIIMAGLVASFLIGIVYFTPPTFLILYALRKSRSLLKTRWLKFLILIVVLNVGLIFLGEILGFNLLMEVSTSVFVVGIIVFTAYIISWKLVTLILKKSNF